MRIPALLLASILPATALAGPFDGLYRPNYDWAESWDCRSAGMDGGALAIEGESFIGIDNPCTLSDPIEVRGMSAVLYDMSCAGEGEPYTQRAMIMSHDFGIYVVTDGLVLDWLRCE